MPTFEEGDEELLKYTVDYIAFSYYRSNTVKTGEFDYERPAHECVNEKQIKTLIVKQMMGLGNRSSWI